MSGCAEPTRVGTDGKELLVEKKNKPSLHVEKFGHSVYIKTAIVSRLTGSQMQTCASLFVYF